MTYVERLIKRRNALREAYTADDSKPEHRDCIVLVSVLVDVALAAKVAERDLDDIIIEAQEIADHEWYFTEAALREAQG